MDGEIGRFEFATYRVEEHGKMVYNTVGEVFPVVRCWEWYKTKGFKEIALIHGATENSYTKTAALINRVRHQEDGTPSTTVRESVRQEGKKILECLERTTQEILEREGVDEAGCPISASAESQQEAKVLASQQIRQAIEHCDVSEEECVEMSTNPVVYEEPSDTVNISLDDVVVKKQKAQRTRKQGEQRSSPPKSGQHERSDVDTRKYVHNTVAHIQHEAHSYSVNGPSVVVVLRFILGYLLKNHLLSYRLQFFVDGQKTLQAAILRAFSWFKNIGLILDWYHLDDKCRRQLSLAMRGTDIRNEILHTLMRYLWYGLIDKAIEYLQGIQENLMKNPQELHVLIGYLERNRPYLPCYAVRKQLGLRNSSNIGEKMNDLLVAERQKHQGMSWSPGGSIYLAAIEAIKRNDEYQHWFEYEQLEFKWAA